MDKVITGVIIVLVVGFFYWLSQQDDAMPDTATGESADGGAWEAMVGMGDDKHSAGHYASYDDCVAAVREKVDVVTTPYSCSQ